MPFVMSTDGTPIHYEMAGQGRPLVLTHGLATDLTVWELAGYVDALAHDHLLVMIDALGHGRTGRPSDPSTHTDERKVQDVLMVADAAGLERFALWGWSAGAWTGWVTAEAAPERVVALIATGQWELEPEVTDEPWEQWYRWIRQPVEQQGMQVVVERMEEIERGPIPDWMRDLIVRTDPEVFLAANTKEDFRRGFTDLSVFRLPVLLIAGEFEDPDESVRQLAHRLPHAESHVLPGLGHCGAFVRSALAVPIVRVFLERVFPWPGA
jgi:pimeloyl-ACP methyl ester carboxylesterase